MNKTRNFITLLSLLLLCSTNLCADEAMAKRWGYATVGFGILTALSAIGFGYKCIQLKRNNNALLNKDKNLTPKQLEKILKLKKRNELWRILLGFSAVLGGSATAFCLYKRQQENNKIDANKYDSDDENKCKLCHGRGGYDGKGIGTFCLSCGKHGDNNNSESGNGANKKNSHDIENDKSNNWLLENTKPCPKCKANICKDEGCNHMTCRCGHHFCWLCGAEYANSRYGAYACSKCGKNFIVNNN
jgi:hypothetical protein